MPDERKRSRRPPISITVDGTPIEANKGELVIAAAERHGVHIPRFCYHPRMREVGMCRMCLVEIDSGRGPALQPACMIPVAENMTVDTQSDRTRKAQDGVLEFLLINHPLDCPVCDKGGECPLQDNTVAFGPGESRFVEEKRHYEKPIAISDLVFLDRERCILCDRCTRFAKDVAGDPLIHFVEPRCPHRGQHLPRRAVRQLLQRQHRADLSRRCAHRQAVPLPRPPVGSRRGRVDLHHLQRRLLGDGSVEPQQAAALPGGGQRRGQLVAGCATGAGSPSRR